MRNFSVAGIIIVLINIHGFKDAVINHYIGKIMCTVTELSMGNIYGLLLRRYMAFNLFSKLSIYLSVRSYTETL